MLSSQTTTGSSCRRRTDLTRSSSIPNYQIGTLSKTKNRFSIASTGFFGRGRCSRIVAVFLVVTLSAIVLRAVKRRSVAIWAFGERGTATGGFEAGHRNTAVLEDQTLILVLSAQNNRRRRDAIRETWGKQSSNIRFAVGHNGDLSLANEAAACQDMILIDAIDDTYDALSQKLYAALQYLVVQSNFKWIVKADDDMFLHLDTLDHLLKAFNPQTPMVIGCILQDEPVRNYGKWNEQIFDAPIYPTFPQGSCGYVMSYAVVQYVLGATPQDFYHGEDTSLGIWLFTWRSQHDDKPVVRWVHAPSLFVNDGDCENHPNAVIVGHKISPENMRKCFSSSHSQQTRQAEDILQIGNLQGQDNKKDSLEYKQAIERHAQKQYSVEREREREQKRKQREQQRQRLVRKGKT